MTRMIQCVKLGKQAEGLETPPVPGESGRRIYEQVSKEAWGAWMQRQTILINEYKLSVVEPEARAFLEREMNEFLFGSESGSVEDDPPAA